MDSLDVSQICILCTKSIADGRIGKFFSDRGVIRTYTGEAIGEYYFSDGRTIIVSRKKPEFRQLINPWKKRRRKFPREMMVSDNKIDWRRRTVIARAKTNWPFIAIKLGFSAEDNFIECRSWKYAKEIK